MHATRYIYRYVESHRQDFLALRSCETITCAHPHLLRFHDNDHHQLTASKQLVWIWITLELKGYQFRRYLTAVFYKLKSSTKRA